MLITFGEDFDFLLIILSGICVQTTHLYSFDINEKYGIRAEQFDNSSSFLSMPPQSSLLLVNFMNRNVVIQISSL